MIVDLTLSAMESKLNDQRVREPWKGIAKISVDAIGYITNNCNFQLITIDNKEALAYTYDDGSHLTFNYANPEVIVEGGVTFSCPVTYHDCHWEASI